MTIAFRDRALAELCNSRERLVATWGQQVGLEVGRRLIELHAADPSTVAALPRAHVHIESDGSTVIQFGGELEVRCQTDSVDFDSDCFVVTAITVIEEEL